MFVEVNPNGQYRTNITLDDTCKICKKVTSPIKIEDNTNQIDFNHYRLCITRYCHQCKHYFIDEFDVVSEGGVYSNTSYEVTYIDVKPELPSDIPISDDISLISPIGKEIYLQALKAEQERLDHIAGIGYRKALEFFVKDFSIVTNPDDEEKIIKMSLKQVIEKYIKDEDLKTFALASAYIGNDEGHYYRNNPDKDFTHLKNYLHGVIHYMEMKLNFLDAQELVNRSKKS